jgi:hypothetical protein
MSLLKKIPLLTLSLLATGVCAAEVQETALPIRYTIGEPGRVSLAVYDATGRMVRPIHYGQPHVPGQYTVLWDGLDRYGDPLPPGSYEWRLLRTPGFGRELLVNVGVNTPWSPFDVWPGNHFGPNVALIDPVDGGLYVGSVSSEGPPSIVKIAIDGSKKFWDDHSLGYSAPITSNGLCGLARVGVPLFYLVGTQLYVRDPATFENLAHAGHPEYTSGLFANLTHAGDTQTNFSPMRLAGGADFLAITYQNYNETRFTWPGGPNIVKDITVSVPKPVDVTAGAGETAYVLANGGTSIVKVDLTTNAVTTVASGLPTLKFLSYDASSGDILVSDGNYVQNFSMQLTRLGRSCGNPNGRTYGVFSATDFGNILDLKADGKGGFVTVEQFPRRVAHFRGREKYELVNQWFGGTQWGSLAAIDPVNPTSAYLPTDPRHLGRGKIDYKTKTWTLTHIYDEVSHSSWNVGSSSHPDILPTGGERSFWEVRHVSGQTFLVNRGAGLAAGSVTILRVDDKQNRLLPVAYLGGLHPTIGHPDVYLAALKRMGIRYPLAAGPTHRAFSWSDTNQNGLVDPEEISLASVGIRYGSYSCSVGPNWDITCPIESRGSAWSVIANEGTLECPKWNWDHARPGDCRYATREREALHPIATSIYRDQSGGTYLTVNNRLREWDFRDVPPMNWPNNKSHSSRLLKWDPQGVESFSVGRHTDSKSGAAGEFSEVRAVLAEVKDCLVIMDACAPAGVWTRDGLYAGGFNDDVGLPAKLEGWKAVAFRKRPHDDNQWGQVIETSAGDVLWGQMRDNSTPFFRITGWKNWERKNGQLTLKATVPSARRSGSGLVGTYFATPDLAGKPIFTAVDPVIQFGPMRGDHREVPAGLSWFNQRDPRLDSQKAPVSVRWTGWVEGPLSEDFKFRVYIYGRGRSGARVRLWIANKLLIDSWNDITLEQFKTNWPYTRELISAPIPLQVGKRVPIRIEYATPRIADAHLHLYWSSLSFDLRHVPRVYLYPDEADFGRSQVRAGEK